MSRALCVLAVCLMLAGAARAGTSVTLNTNVGDITIELHDTAAPATSWNFLEYVYSEAYLDVMFHRSADLAGGVPFVLQTGGFALYGGSWDAIPTNAPVVNEPGTSNTRGTIAMAKLEDDPDSATNQFFFNLGDNSANLDSQNGGFTVFAHVTDGMDLVDAIASLPTSDLRSYFSPAPWAGAMAEVPIATDDQGGEWFLMIRSIDAPMPTPGDATHDGTVDVYDLAALANNYGRPGNMAWTDGDFNGDDTVDLYDLVILANAYGVTGGTPGGSAGTPVPEPATMLTLLLAAPFAMRRRRRSRAA